ncbi:phospholipase D-like domain-containing protein [Propylenella binzhouense]|uniref:Phospholipase D n=1 Tax=Propylenella binzhouense TaxID=2555902 RepID=A0A964T1Z9_9HYPH|nr:phospholipase D-like domain-containing protein [Propylenella binzhouense]MYZ46484.1 phospholipase [Propylenella binzhouense]
MDGLADARSGGSGPAASDGGAIPAGAAAGHASAVQPILEPGRNCWRIERADRIALLVDAISYFGAAKAAMRKARRSVMLIGWDYDPRIRLEPHREDAAQPDVLGDLLDWLVANRPGLEVRVLRWDMPLPMALAKYPKIALRIRDWMTSVRLKLKLDGTHPAGASHHQKLLVVDHSIAFCGGIDFGCERWDRPGHVADDPCRVDPDGAPYPPRHDVAMAVTGPIVAALSEVARERWRRATGEAVAPLDCSHDCWPDDLEINIRNGRVGIARTEPEWYAAPSVRESGALFVDMIAAARRSIILENQYFTGDAIVGALAARLSEPDGPEIVVINPAHSPGRFERMAMDTVRTVQVERMRRADRYGRFRIYSPFNAAGQAVIIHSKVAVIDDRLLRIGTSNISNRSIGFDTECDLAIESRPGEPGAAEARETIRAFAVRLLAEHCGVEPDAFAAAYRETGRLAAAIDSFAEGKRLRPMPESRPSAFSRWAARNHLFDPVDSGEAWWLLRRPWRPRRPSGGPRLRSGAA